MAQMRYEIDPRLTFLFSGHMVDQPDRQPPRFPDAKSTLANAAIGKALDDFGATHADLAICGGACGGDLLFARQCLDRGMTVHIYLPFAEPAFLEKSVNFAGASWIDRYRAVKHNQNAHLSIMTGQSGDEENSFAQNNLRMLDDALALGSEKLCFIALWNGREGDGPGGTKHMIESVKQRNGQVRILDTNQIFA